MWFARARLKPSFGISFEFSGSVTGLLSTPRPSSVHFRGFRMLSRSPPRVGIGFPCPPLTIFRDLVRFLRQRHRCDFGAGEFQPLGWPRDHPVPYNGRKPVIRNCLYGTLLFFPAGEPTTDKSLRNARNGRPPPVAVADRFFIGRAP